MGWRGLALGSRAPSSRGFVRPPPPGHLEGLMPSCTAAGLPTTTTTCCAQDPEARVCVLPPDVLPLPSLVTNIGLIKQQRRREQQRSRWLVRNTSSRRRMVGVRVREVGEGSRHRRTGGWGGGEGARSFWAECGAVCPAPVCGHGTSSPPSLPAGLYMQRLLCCRKESSASDQPQLSTATHSLCPRCPQEAVEKARGLAMAQVTAGIRPASESLPAGLDDGPGYLLDPTADMAAAAAAAQRADSGSDEQLLSAFLGSPADGGSAPACALAGFGADTLQRLAYALIKQHGCEALGRVDTWCVASDCAQ